MFHNYETEKITREANDVAEYIELFGSSAGICSFAWGLTALSAQIGYIAP